MKKIFIIDDNIDRVLEDIFGKIYKTLWKGKNEEGIAAEVIFFGDKFKRRRGDGELQQENIDFAIKYVKRLLSSHCRDEEQWDNNGEMYKNKKRLIENLAKHIRMDENSEIEEIVKIWRDKEALTGKVNLKEMDFTPLIDQMLQDSDYAGIEQADRYILLDVILLFDDIEQVEDGVPIISMGLYYALKKQGYNCYLYSTYAFDYVLMDNYREIYKNRYEEDVEVYPRKDFFSEKNHSKKSLFYQIGERG